MSISDSDGISRWQIGAGMFIADVIIGGTRPYGYGFRVASRNDWSSMPSVLLSEGDAFTGTVSFVSAPSALKAVI
jgi:hypothetical protein